MPVGGFAKHGVEPLPGFDEVLNGAILVIRRELDTVHSVVRISMLSPRRQGSSVAPRYSG